MFGKPQWFRQKHVGGGLIPRTWQGWVYAMTWLGILALPAFALFVMARLPEAIVWLVVAIGLLFWDAVNISRQIRAAEAEENLFVIDEETDVSRITTEKYEFQLRDE